MPTRKSKSKSPTTSTFPEYLEVYNGAKKATRGGLTKKDLTVNSRGRVVSKKRSQNAAKRFQKSNEIVKVAAELANEECRARGRTSPKMSITKRRSR